MELRECMPFWFELDDHEIQRTPQSVVVKAQDQRLVDSCPDKAVVALKCIPRGPELPTDVQDEVLLQRRIWHRHIFGFREVFLTKSHLCMIFEHSSGSSVAKLVLRYGRLPEDLARRFFQQIILVVDYYHRLDIVNRDIKLDNILLEVTENGTGIIKLCDFGMSKAKPSQSDVFLEQNYYTAPEARLGDSSGLYCDGYAADIWACGVCLFYMLYGAFYVMKRDSLPDNRSSMEFTEEVIIPERVRGSNESLSEQCRDLLRCILQVDPANRMAMDEIWSNEWFRVDMPDGCQEYNTRITTDTDLLDGHLKEMQSPEDMRNAFDLAKEVGDVQQLDKTTN